MLGGVSPPAARGATMLELRETPGSNIVELVIDGRISRDDFDRAIEIINRVIEEHGSVKLLEDIRAFGAVDPSLIWEDLKWAFAHFKDISKTAIVADRKWLEWYTNIFKPFVKMEVRYFDSSEIDDARRWLAEPPEQE
ncbi:STAS/SEC14 domain-containing protein [Oceanidesulfovibrio marinus]|nr:STAS/SEC14 domain-containing protein [Oceanidesulfovibrio marinus]